MNHNDTMRTSNSNMENTKPIKNRNIQSLGMAVALLALSGSVASAQFSILHSFTGGADGANPYYDAPVVSGLTLYGTANQGAAGGGVVFAVNTDGTGFNVLHTFTNSAPDGYQPLGSVVLSGSTLYGTTYYGGSANGTSGNGTVFAVNVDGSGYQTLHSFTTATGSPPTRSTSNTVFDSLSLEASSCFIALMNFPFLYSTFATFPSHGLRFTCTLKTDRKIPTRIAGPPSHSSCASSVISETVPSAGLTIASCSLGTPRCGSRKNANKKISNGNGNIASGHHARPSPNAIAAKTSDPINISRNPCRVRGTITLQAR